MALRWTLSGMSTSLLNLGVQDWIQYSKCGPTAAEQSREEGSLTPLDLLAVLDLMQPGYH